MGNSIGTGDQGLVGNVIEINGMEELKITDKNLVNGKIVFLNQPLDNSIINTWDAYAKVSDQRNHGALQASIKGAIAVIVRSLSSSNDDSPHAGYTGYDESVKKIYFDRAIEYLNRIEIIQQGKVKTPSIGDKSNKGKDNPGNSKRRCA